MGATTDLTMSQVPVRMGDYGPHSGSLLRHTGNPHSLSQLMQTTGHGMPEAIRKGMGVLPRDDL
eukprot:1633621-Rhodomonas_salina.1